MRGQSEKDCKNRTGRTGQAKQNRQNRTARKMYGYYIITLI
jgi:hypothetical protein